MTRRQRAVARVVRVLLPASTEPSMVLLMPPVLSVTFTADPFLLVVALTVAAAVVGVGKVTAEATVNALTALVLVALVATPLHRYICNAGPIVLEHRVPNVYAPSV
jgi:hypothetical protein